MIVTIDTDSNVITVGLGGSARQYPISSSEGFDAVSAVWLRSGWDVKYVYSFSWLGRPVIQLPEDLIRLQEVIYQLRPTVIIETGVAHGGSLVFHASVLRAMGIDGRVIGIDVEIRRHNRSAIEQHELSSSIVLVEGDSVASAVVEQVASMIKPTDTVLVVLDSNHSRAHVLSELHAYSRFVTPGSYIIACDGIMKDLVGAPRSSADWSWNNPQSAIDEFLSSTPSFENVEPRWPFNEGAVTHRVTYWPRAYLRRLAT